MKDRMDPNTEYASIDEFKEYWPCAKLEQFSEVSYKITDPDFPEGCRLVSRTYSNGEKVWGIMQVRSYAYKGELLRQQGVWV
jgi:hypothetical protein